MLWPVSESLGNGDSATFLVRTRESPLQQPQKEKALSAEGWPCSWGGSASFHVMLVCPPSGQSQRAVPHLPVPAMSPPRSLGVLAPSLQGSSKGGKALESQPQEGPGSREQRRGRGSPAFILESRCFYIQEFS